MADHDWQDSIPTLLKKIEDARSHASPLQPTPALQHRLSVGGQDAAALSVTRQSLSAEDTAIAMTNDWSPSCKSCVRSSAVSKGLGETDILKHGLESQ